MQLYSPPFTLILLRLREEGGPESDRLPERVEHKKFINESSRVQQKVSAAANGRRQEAG